MKYTIFGKLVFVAAPMVCAALIAGCGGSSSSSSGSPGSAQITTPQIFGINSTQFNSLSLNAPALSGFTSADLNTGYATGAYDSNSVPLSSVANGFNSNGIGTIALGFPSGGTYNSTGTSGFASAMVVGQPTQVEFNASVTDGQNSSGTAISINTVSLSSTDSEWGLGTVPLTAVSTSGIASSANYRTAAFAEPFKTSGIHTAVASVTDVNGTTTTTKFDTVVISPSDYIGAVLVQVTFDDTATSATLQIDPVAYEITGVGAAKFTPAHVSITGGVATAHPYIPNLGGLTPSAPGDTDQNGVAILFAAPGSQTINVSAISPLDGVTTLTGTAKVNVVAGQLTDTINSNTPLTIELTAPTSSVRKLAVPRIAAQKL